MIIAIVGFTPRDEVIVDQIRRENPEVKILLFSASTNKALEERVDYVYPITLERLQGTLVDPISNILPDLILIGSEQFSLAGVKDLLKPSRVPVIGASKEQMRIEIDKSFIRTHSPEIRQFYPPFLVLSKLEVEQILSFIKEHPEYVVKYNGSYHQIGGGVKLYGSHLHTFEETLNFINLSLLECGIVVLEKQISGQDFSINALSSIDGNVYFFPENVCYKRRNNGNTGPNTSGTGSYAISSGLPFLSETEQLMAQNIVRQIIRWTEIYFNAPFVSGLNVDFRKGDDGKIYLLEVNSRFAGAGTLSTVLSLNQIKLMDLFLGAVDGSLGKFEPAVSNNISLSIFAYPKFWPDGVEGNQEVFIPRATIMPSTIRLFTGWVNVQQDLPQGRIVTLKQSTTLLFQTVSQTWDDAQQRLYAELSKLAPELEYRTDIGVLN